MQLALTAKNNTDNVRSSLSYINTLITNAANDGEFFTIIDGIFMDDYMMETLITDYGYEITKEYFDIGSYPRYKIFY